MVMVSPWDTFADVISTYPSPWLRPFTILLKWYSDHVIQNTWDTGTNLSLAIKNLAKYLENNPVSKQQKLRIHLFHGTKDTTVDISQAEALEQRIKTQISKLPTRIQKHFEINLHKLEGGGHFTDLELSQLPITEILSVLNNNAPYRAQNSSNIRQNLKISQLSI